MTGPQPTGEQPLDYAPPPKVPMSAMGIVSMILGVIATPLDGLFEVGLLVGIAACITGAISVGRINRLGQRGKGFALAGIILGCVSLLVGITCGLWLFGQPL